MKHHTNALKRKLGPLPVWGWAIIAGVILYVVRNRQGGGGLLGGLLGGGSSSGGTTLGPTAGEPGPMGPPGRPGKPGKPPKHRKPPKGKKPPRKKHHKVPRRKKHHKNASHAAPHAAPHAPPMTRTRHVIAPMTHARPHRDRTSVQALGATTIHKHPTRSRARFERFGLGVVSSAREDATKRGSGGLFTSRSRSDTGHPIEEGRGNTGTPLARTIRHSRTRGTVAPEGRQERGARTTTHSSSSSVSRTPIETHAPAARPTTPQTTGRTGSHARPSHRQGRGR